MADKIKVLMVDDEERFRKTTSNLLRKRGFETTIAASGEEAIRILIERPYDVVVLDIKMHGMDGHEALSRIKGLRPKTQVIMLTGHGTAISAKESLTRNAFDYLNKPCSIDILSTKINDAYHAMHHDETQVEKKARDIMIHVGDYTTITADSTIKEAIQKLMTSFKEFVSSSRLMETGHRSLLVFDTHKNLVGMLSILDLIQAVRPAYLSAPKPSMADSMQYSSMFWSGLFTSQVKSLAEQKVGDIMSDSPPTVDEDSNLMEVADVMYKTRSRRVIITAKGSVIGIVREQEIFFEIANLIL